MPLRHPQGSRGLPQHRSRVMRASCAVQPASPGSPDTPLLGTGTAHARPRAPGRHVIAGSPAVALHVHGVAVLGVRSRSGPAAQGSFAAAALAGGCRRSWRGRDGVAAAARAAQPDAEGAHALPARAAARRLRPWPELRIASCGGEAPLLAPGSQLPVGVVCRRAAMTGAMQ